ncbi:MAG: LysE family transporter [Bacillota bacterium]|nr:LysE family transporter [Bacillota bacterium]
MPGSMFTYTVDKSLQHGVKSGILVSIGHAILEMLLVILLFMGAAKYLAADMAKTILGIVGGLVLGYMGLGMIRDVYLNKVSLEIKRNESHSSGNMMLAGAVLSGSNPFFIVWWSVVGLALIMSSYNSFGIMGIVVFYIGHILSDISWFTFVAALVSKTRHLINIKVYKVIIIVLAICLIGFGISFFANSLRLAF